MLKRKLRTMIKEHGRAAAKEIIIKEIFKLEKQMAKASNIYAAIDIEHSLLDHKSMLKWLNERNV